MLCSSLDGRCGEDFQAVESLMLRLTKSILTAICYWFLTLAVLFSLPNGFPVIAGAAIYLFLPIAVILLVFTLIAFKKERRKRWSICGALILGVSFLAFEPLLYWGALAHLCLNHQAYKTTAAGVLAAQDDAQPRDICGEECC